MINNNENVDNKYQKVENIAKGGYGSVFKVKEINNPTKFLAVKKMKILEDGIPSFALREIAILKQLDHPNVIK